MIDRIKEILPEKKELPDDMAVALENISNLLPKNITYGGHTRERIVSLSYELGMWMGDNIAIDASAQALLKAEVSEEIIESILKKWVAGTPSNTLESELFTLSWGNLRFIAQALKKEFIILRKGKE